MNFAFTLSIQSDFKIQGLRVIKDSENNKNTFKGKVFFKELTPDQQDHLMFLIVRGALQNVFSLDLDGGERLLTLGHPIYYKRFFNYECESHINIKMNNGELKRHMHGTLFNMTDDSMIQFKNEVFSMLRLKVEKWQNVCLKIVPIYYGVGWNDYCIKDQEKNKTI